MKSNRRRAREFALQGLYQWQLARTEPKSIAAQLAEARGFDKVDTAYFHTLLEGAVGNADTLAERLAPCMDRAFAQLSPVERAILMLAGYELMHQHEIPYRVVINEAVELAKEFGGTDGYKFVNGVLDKLAARIRTSPDD